MAGFNFSESSILAQIYGQALKAQGYNVTFKLNLGNREVVEPALEKGDIDLYPCYAATELEFINKGKGEATPDPAQTVSTLKAACQQEVKETGLIEFQACLDDIDFCPSFGLFQRADQRLHRGGGALLDQ